MSDQENLSDIIEKISKEAHGNPSLKEVNPFLAKNFINTDKAITGFLNVEIVRDPIKWETVKEAVWGTPKEQDDNKFHFVQGDIISTSKVLRLGTSEYNQEHDLWVVRAPSCDCVRAEFVRVSPVIEVTDKNATNFNEFRTALYFTTPNRFPIPSSILDDGEKRFAFYADLIEPFYLKAEDKEDVIVLKSLQPNGWHLFNAVNGNLQSRANVEEELKFRS